MNWDDDWDSGGGYQSDNYGEYECVNQGCINGVGHVFRAAPPGWFSDNNLSTPKNCPDCKDWIDEQKAMDHRGDTIVATCCLCGYKWQVYCNYRISYYRNIGNWDDYWVQNASKQICKKCEETPGRRRKLISRTAELRKRRAREAGVSYQKAKDTAIEGDGLLKGLFNLVGFKGIGPTNSYNVPYDLGYYHRISDQEHETALNHIVRPDHRWLQNMGTQDPNTIMNMAYRVSISTEKHVLEFKLEGNRVMKYDTNQRMCVLIVRDNHSPTRNRILTAYPKKLVAVSEKVESGKWKCS